MSSTPYQLAATLLNKLWDKDQRCSLKSLVFDKNSELLCSKTTYAQVCQVQKHFATLQKVLERVTSLPVAKNQGLLYVLLYELLLGPNKGIRGGGALKRTLIKHQVALQQALDQAQPQSSEEPGHHHFPRYVRVNALRTTSREVLEHIRHQRSAAADLSVYADPHVSDLLVLPPGSTPWLKQDSWLNDLKSNRIVLQEKSSCFSALCLVHGYGTASLLMDGGTTTQRVDWIDACAAPGNKTSHLAALVAQQQLKHPHLMKNVSLLTCSGVLYPDHITLLCLKQNKPRFWFAKNSPLDQKPVFVFAFTETWLV
jgi:25S rRNA (cytosine2278-C5)-methyltransferase